MKLTSILCPEIAVAKFYPLVPPKEAFFGFLIQRTENMKVNKNSQPQTATMKSNINVLLQEKTLLMGRKARKALYQKSPWNPIESHKKIRSVMWKYQSLSATESLCKKIATGKYVKKCEEQRLAKMLFPKKNKAKLPKWSKNDCDFYLQTRVFWHKNT